MTFSVAERESVVVFTLTLELPFVPGIHSLLMYRMCSGLLGA
jgi:hypothetical protein